MMAPVVMALQDSNGNGVIDVHDMPSVIFMSYISGGSYAEEGILRALRGDNGKEIFSVTKYKVNALGSLAVGDIDNDGLPDIIAPRYGGRNVWNSGIYAFSNTGKFKWFSHDKHNKLVPLPISWGGPALADLDGDGHVEVVVGNAVVRGKDGLVLCRGSQGMGSQDGRRPLSTIADLNGDGKQEIVTGSTAYFYNCQQYWHNGLPDGYVAVADFNGDKKPEIAVVASGILRIQNGQTGKLILQASIPGGGGGPPTIADFDGDGHPDVAAAGRDYYVVYSPDFRNNRLKLLWKFKTQDHSSAQTGSSVFDFEGDGKAEVIYNDERFMRVFDGKTGKVLYSIANSSGTTLEYPLIVDVNNDGRAEIVFCSNNGSMAHIRVFRDLLDNWVDTRNVWNQHTYHITNICTGDSFCPPGNKFGQIPKHPLKNWRQPGLNNFRQNHQGKGIFKAADLILIDFQSRWIGCTQQIEISFRLVNQGAKKIPAHVPITLYQGTPPKTFKKLLTLKTSQELLPGESLYVHKILTFSKSLPSSITVAADDNGSGKHTRNECNKSNNNLSRSLPRSTTKELCDGKDNDCDGKIDETFPKKNKPCHVGQGECRKTGRYICSKDKKTTICNVQPTLPKAEQCDGKDNDCNGKIDDNLLRTCQSICGQGTQRCQNGHWTPCNAPKPKKEECNDRDDDCDGKIDENLRRPCQSACGKGHEICSHGLWVHCSAPQPKPESCNGKDDDCNGKIDDKIPPKICVNACGKGQQQCHLGHWTKCSAPTPQPEQCDGKDNDCDGKIDENLQRPCHSVCGSGIERCQFGQWEHCSAPQPEKEACDGHDNDCDGKIDNNAICPDNKTCIDGLCRSACHNGECAKGQKCLNGYCIDQCSTPCPDDQRCKQGKCVDACRAIQCPKDFFCIDGQCTQHPPSQENNEENLPPDTEKSLQPEQTPVDGGPSHDFTPKENSSTEKTSSESTTLNDQNSFSDLKNKDDILLEKTSGEFYTSPDHPSPQLPNAGCTCHQNNSSFSLLSLLFLLLSLLFFPKKSKNYFSK